MSQSFAVLSPLWLWDWVRVFAKVSFTDGNSSDRKDGAETPRGFDTYNPNVALERFWVMSGMSELVELESSTAPI
ncbi:hypothetical protein M0804_009277 [Polistes exclamans]|nr:hypothetical protein M0804_009277 [Polistes exclamans]